MKLLIVEDNYQMRRLIKSIVAGIADEVLECCDGSEALEAYLNHRPDWVLMDIEMKMLDGISATRQIKAAAPEGRIVILTEHDDPEMREEAQAAGAGWYVLKDTLSDILGILQPRPIKPDG